MLSYQSALTAPTLDDGVIEKETRKHARRNNSKGYRAGVRSNYEEFEQAFAAMNIQWRDSWAEEAKKRKKEKSSAGKTAGRLRVAKTDNEGTWSRAHRAHTRSLGYDEAFDVPAEEGIAGTTMAGFDSLQLDQTKYTKSRRGMRRSLKTTTIKEGPGIFEIVEEAQSPSEAYSMMYS